MAVRIIPGISITAEQEDALKVWIAANKKMETKGFWISGMTMGSAYVDTRFSKGSRTDGRAAYVKLDEETAKILPDYIGSSREDISAFLAERTSLAPPASAKAVRPASPPSSPAP